MTELKRTPLYELNKRFGAKMVPFAGYEMPLQFKDGMLGEHKSTRESAGLFDVSHMGQITIRNATGSLEDVKAALETMMPVDIIGLAPGRQRYAIFTNDDGGILDDLMVAIMSDRIRLVVNASRKMEDFAHLESVLGKTCDLELDEDSALVAVQGPKAETAVSRLLPGVEAMRFMDIGEFSYEGTTLPITRSGYTGEDGFEISLPATVAESFVEELLRMDEVSPVGLGARDTLRLEAGLCLYGNDITEETTPVEAGLVWSIQKVRRAGGNRSGGFPGHARIQSEMANAPHRKRVGLRPEGRALMRPGTVLFADQSGETRIGEVTSGGFGPTIAGPISMGYVLKEFTEAGTTVYGSVRGKLLPATVKKPPFVMPSFKR